jgi:N-acyl-D-amino-acid deacylase
MHDLVIRGGTIVDGTGAPSYIGDLAIKDGRIVEVGGKAGPGTREIDASDQVVCPGFIDTHTHFDGQVTWDPHLSPSSWHGVTTVIMGNCGVGFAPVRLAEREYLCGVMEGVEDIPGTALMEGMIWDWETFPEYLDSLERQKRSIDVGLQVPHCALRVYVMGRGRGLDTDATPVDIREMARLTKEAVEAGALGFSTSRTFIHLTVDGELVPGTHSQPEELLGIAKGMAEGGSAVFQLISDKLGQEPDIAWMKEIGKTTGRPVIFSMVDLNSANGAYAFRPTLASLKKIYETEGIDIRAAVPWRTPGFLMGLETSLHPFSYYKTFKELEDKPLDQILQRMKQVDFRRAVLADRPDMTRSLTGLANRWDKMFPMSEPPNYEPGPEDSIEAQAKVKGVSPQELAYDTLLQQGGKQLLFVPVAGYAEGNLDSLYEMLTHSRTTASLSDAGAHCPSICDASFTTFMFTHWVKGRKHGERMQLEEVVRKQTSEPADIYALNDRGVIAPGKKADLNVIDLDALYLHAPYLVRDLPAGGKRMLQKVDGFRYTIVSGEVIVKDGEMTDARPGRVIRGPQH